MSTSQANGTAIALSLVAMLAGILSLAAILSAPAFTCWDRTFKWTDLARQDDQRALEVCTKLGGELQPASGFWMSSVAGVIFFGAGGAAIYTGRRRNTPQGRAPSGSPQGGAKPTPDVATAQTLVQSRPVVAAHFPAREEAQTPSQTTAPFTTRSLANRLEQARPASFGIRATAFLIDLVAVTVLAIALIAIIQLPFSQEQKESSALGFVSLFVMAATFVGYEAISTLGNGTLGMRAFGLRVIPVGRAVVDGQAAILRAVVLLAGGSILVGPFSGLWHKEGRAWHDLCSGTGVVRLAD